MNDSSREYMPGDKFKAITGAFCDGFQVCLGEVQSEYIYKSKSVIEDTIRDRAEDFIIKNLLISAKKGKTYIWFTLTSESANMSSKTMT